MKLRMTIEVELTQEAFEQLDRNREYFEREVLGNLYLKSTKIRYVGEVTKVDKSLDYIMHTIKP